jgi:hypothetical protein
MKTILCLLCLSSCVLACSGNGGGYEIKAPVLPGYLKRLGLPVPMYNPRIL